VEPEAEPLEPAFFGPPGARAIFSMTPLAPHKSLLRTMFSTFQQLSKTYFKRL